MAKLAQNRVFDVERHNRNSQTSFNVIEIPSERNFEFGLPARNNNFVDDCSGNPRPANELDSGRRSVASRVRSRIAMTAQGLCCRRVPGAATAADGTATGVAMEGTFGTDTNARRRQLVLRADT